MPGDDRVEITRVVRDFRAIRDVELAEHVAASGDLPRSSWRLPTPTLLRFAWRIRWRYFR